MSIISFGQIKDSTIFVWQCELNYSFHFSELDMKKAFGNSSTMGVGLSFKSKRNFIYGFEVSYLWGGNVKDSLVLSNLMTSTGNIINRFGNYGNLRLSESGFYAGLKVGKVFAFKKPNPNSGIVLNVSGGLLQHRIRIEDRSNNTPPVLGDYKKGYDRLRNGFALKEFLGYQYLSSNRLVNFYVGIECIQAWTEARRDYDFNLHGHDDTKYLDLLWGFRVGWILPLYKHNPHEYYYN